ncbi:DUF2157 domain-containing protein [Effusibacillus consociatus]|uniref:DUF2157 domain-containing protein n=1 Tax=Effusibacillus consociatus TaxID=1117041 RepID=A0ABV9Q569_9BACL
MNHHKWLHGEVEKWKEEGLVNETVVESLKSRYPVTSIESAGLMMFFAALLVGIGGIFFIAHNWTEMPSLLKLAIIFAGMIVFYGAGEYIRASGRTAVGISLIFLGTLTFGAGIFLIGQMFHIVAYNAGALLGWSIATASIAWIYRNPYLMMAAVVQWAFATWFQFEEYSRNPLLFLLVSFAYFWIAFHWKSRRILLLVLAGLVPGVLSVLFYYDASQLWAYPVLLLVFGLSLLFHNSSFPQMFQYPMLLSVYVAVIVQSTLFRENWIRIEPSPTLYIAAGVLLIAIIAYLWQEKMLNLLPAAAIFLPTAELEYAEFVNAALAIAVSIFFISLGERRKEKAWINHGTLLFLISVFFLYVMNVWSFLDSSLFFVIGGILLFVLAIFMERRRRKLLSVIREVE